MKATGISVAGNEHFFSATEVNKWLRAISRHALKSDYVSYAERALAGEEIPAKTLYGILKRTGTIVEHESATTMRFSEILEKLAAL